MTNKDLKQAPILVHNLKGLVGNLEVTDRLAAAAAMETLVKGQAAETGPDEELIRKLTELESDTGNFFKPFLVMY